MNRKQILSSATIAAFAGILLAWAPSAAYGGGGPMIGMAFTDEGFTCSMIGPTGALAIQTDPDNIIVESNDKNNHIKLTCHFSGVPTNEGKAWVERNLALCGIATDDQLVFTTNTLNVVSADGEGLLTCFFRG